jgi:hypothetical protein
MAIATVQQISTQELVELLIAANVTDPRRWPAGLERGADHLRRIREIEQDCVKQHGRWDGALLPEELEDEYDDNCALLNQIRRALDPEPNTPFNLGDY